MLRFLSTAIGLVGGISLCFSQLTQEWAMSQLQSYSNTSYEILKGFKSNGSYIVHDGFSRSFSMQHLKYCELKDLKSFLNSIDITVHETTHAFDSQIPYMKAKKGANFVNLSNTEGFYLNPYSIVCIEFPKNKLFPSKELIKEIPESLRTFRFNIYINAGPTQSTQCNGIVGLLDEFNAYYHGSKVLYDLYPLFSEEYGSGVKWSWSSKFISNAEAFYEFDFFIKEYLLYAKQYHPLLYQELRTHPTLSYVYKTIRQEFSTLLANYEKKVSEINKSNKSESSTEKYGEIHKTLLPTLQSNRYQAIEADFLK
ncbi:MAG: hypothetical protein EB023_09940 [Flavobacteriia bacterium]|nr:hypothetical protein [Flavobacteriia bacterium]